MAKIKISDYNVFEDEPTIGKNWKSRYNEKMMKWDSKHRPNFKSQSHVKNEIKTKKNRREIRKFKENFETVLKD